MSSRDDIVMFPLSLYLSVCVFISSFVSLSARLHNNLRIRNYKR